MKKRETVYVCDNCGVVSCLCFCRSALPTGWTKSGKEHLCPKCSEIYQNIKVECKFYENKSKCNLCSE